MSRPFARWHHWAIFATALALAVSPWLLGYAWHAAATANAAVAGLALALTAHIEASCELSLEWLNFAAGLWRVAAPFVLGFTAVPLAAASSAAVGAAVAALAAAALLLHHGIGKRFGGHAIRR